MRRTLGGERTWAAAPARGALAERPQRPMLAEGFGMQLHAARTVDGRDRAQLERLCRYMLRPPFATDAVERLSTGDGDERVRLRLKAPRRDGRRHVDMDIDTFLARLAALVPPPRFNLVRYYGVLANRHRLRERLLPAWTDPEPRQLPLAGLTGVPGLPRTLVLGCTGESAEASRVLELRDPSPSRIAWGKLLARVFKVDVSTCRRCGGRMRVDAAVTRPDDIARELRGARPPLRPEPPGRLRLFGGRECGAGRSSGAPRAASRRGEVASEAISAWS